MTDLTREGRRLAIITLKSIEQTLTQMSAWVDGDEADRQRTAIWLEDAAALVRSAGWTLERIDPETASQLAHRRMVTSAGGTC
jgi:hypothetical protein